MHDAKAMPFAILVTDAFGRPTTAGINDVGWAFDGLNDRLECLVTNWPIVEGSW